jgi:hypothetical protein
MTHSHSWGQGLRIGRWILPWIAVVFASPTIGYAMNSAIAGDPWAGHQQRDAQDTLTTGAAVVERSTTSPSAQSADLGPSVTPERCAPIGSGFMGSSIVAESRKIDCGWAP